MTHIIELEVIDIELEIIDNHAAMDRFPPPATDRPYLTAHEVLRAGIRRTTGRRDMAAAQSTWDSEGGAIEARE